MDVVQVMVHTRKDMANMDCDVANINLTRSAVPSIFEIGFDDVQGCVGQSSR